MATAQNETILPLLKALGNPIRLDILRCVMSGEKCVCVLFERLRLPQNLVSHHLAVLRRNNLIIARKEGRWVHYSLNPIRFTQLKVLIEKFSLTKKIKSQC